MITSLRKHLKHKGFKVILWITIFSLIGGFSAVPLIKNLFFKKDIEGIATVNGYEISLPEYRRQYSYFASLIQEIKRLYGAQADLILSLWSINPEKKPENLALDKLIQEKIIQNITDQLGLNVGKDYIDEKLRDPLFVREYLSEIIPPQVFQDDKLNTSLLIAALERQGVSLDDFETMVANIFKKNLLMQLISGATYVPADDVKEQYIQYYSNKKFNILTLDIKKYVEKASAQKLSDAEIEQYFNQHKEKYKMPERRSADIWSFDPNNYGIIVSEKEAKDYYQNNKQEFIEKEKKEPKYKSFDQVKDEIIKQLKLKKFEKEFNSDAGRILSQAQDVPAIFDKFIENKKAAKSSQSYIEQNESVKSEKIFGLNKIKDKAFYQDQNKGYIVELTGIEKSFIPLLSAVKEKVVQDIYFNKAQELLKKDLKQALKSEKNLSQIAKDLNGLIETTDWVDMQKEDSAKVIKDKNIPLQLVIELTKPKQRTEYITNTHGYIIELQELQPINEQDFKDKKQKLKEQLSQIQLRNIVQDLLSSWKNKAKIEINEQMARKGAIRF